ncbi:hypothetical protein BJX62DRAFT_242224 [Aspergillus germanicus]
MAGPHCPYITRSLKATQDHRRQAHRDQDGHWARARAEARLAERVVSCQRFYLTQASSHFFEVTCTAAPAAQGAKRRPALTPAELVRARVDQALREGEAAMEWEASQVPALDPHPTEVSPWLELTRWPEYLRGQDLTTVALLGALPDPREEPLLVQLSASVQRLINQAYHAICDGQINEFDQVQINTFFRQPSVWNWPIQIHLQPKTYHYYSQVWQHLLAALNRMEEHGQGILALAAQAIKPPTPAAASQDAPPPTPPAPDPLPRWTVPWKWKKDLAVLVGTLPRLAPRPPVPAASPPVAALPSCPP